MKADMVHRGWDPKRITWKYSAQYAIDTNTTTLGLLSFKVACMVGALGKLQFCDAIPASTNEESQNCFAESLDVALINQRAAVYGEMEVYC